MNKGQGTQSKEMTTYFEIQNSLFLVRYSLLLILCNSHLSKRNHQNLFVRNKSYLSDQIRTAMRKMFFLFLAVCFISTCCYSQGTLKGKIVDSTTRQPLGLATVTVFKAADTVIITYRMTTPDGDF